MRQESDDNTNGSCGHMWPARLVLQLHDELLLEVKEGWVDRVRDMVLQEMTGVVRLRVPLRVKWKQVGLGNGYVGTRYS